MTGAVKDILRLLRKAYPAPQIALHHRNALELLVATILSAQCTDARVNAVTAGLFRRYREAADYAGADPAQLEAEIRPTGFYKNKAKTLIRCGRALVEGFGGKVPHALEDLLGLPGVGRKTANLVRAVAFGEPAIAVDTHVRRVSQRLGLTGEDDPDRIEADLERQVPRRHWTEFTLALMLLGREVCHARRPDCAACPLRTACPWPDRPSGGASPS